MTDTTIYEGPTLLRAWLTEHGRTLDWLGRQLAPRRGRATVSTWTLGRSSPDAVDARRIETVTGIPRTAWAPRTIHARRTRKVRPIARTPQGEAPPVTTAEPPASDPVWSS